jgi:DnaJ-class molecular chaperone
MIQTWHKERCKCCGGRGTQHNTQTGLTVMCPCCGGSGQRNVSNMDNLPPGVYCCSK